jgi:hypothetical protein
VPNILALAPPQQQEKQQGQERRNIRHSRAGGGRQGRIDFDMARQNWPLDWCCAKASLSFGSCHLHCAFSTKKKYLPPPPHVPLAGLESDVPGHGCAKVAEGAGVLGKTRLAKRHAPFGVVAFHVKIASVGRGRQHGFRRYRRPAV